MYHYSQHGEQNLGRVCDNDAMVKCTAENSCVRKIAALPSNTGTQFSE